MKIKPLALALLCLLAFACSENSEHNQQVEQVEKPVKPAPYPETITFKSEDGLTVFAHLYDSVPESAPTIVLCHQARYNKLEYAEIAPRLNKLGFRALAIDQRSGGELKGEQNQTFREAQKDQKATDYTDAIPDILAAVDYAYQQYHQPVILWGSSYSAALVLALGTGNEKVKAILAFSPGEYFENEMTIADTLKALNKPVFVTSSQEEAPEVSALMKKAGQQYVTQYKPDFKGTHGSKALWKEDEHSADYWNAVKAFLEKLK